MQKDPLEPDDLPLRYTQLRVQKMVFEKVSLDDRAAFIKKHRSELEAGLQCVHMCVDMEVCCVANMWSVSILQEHH